MPEKEKKQNTEPKKKIGDKIIDSFGVLGKFDPFQTYKFFRDDYKEYLIETNKRKPENKTKPDKKTEPETNAEKKSKRLEELKKEIEGKSKGGFIVGKGADYIKDLF
jgi:non-homologous end joining protein Ku